MNEKCFACGNDKWKVLNKSFNFSGDENITYECTNCGHIETKTIIDKKTNDI